MGARVLAQPEKCGQRQQEGKTSWSPSALTPWPLQLCKLSAKSFRQLAEGWFGVPGIFRKQGSDPSGTSVDYSPCPGDGLAPMPSWTVLGH